MSLFLFQLEPLRRHHSHFHGTVENFALHEREHSGSTQEEATKLSDFDVTV